MTVQSVRIELGDTSTLPVMSDEEIQYFLDKNNGNVRRASLDTAKTMLFKLSMVGDSQVDIFSIRGSASAKAYMQALQMYIKNPDLTSLYNTVEGWAGGISKEDMQANVDNPDNVIPIPPSESPFDYDNTPSSPFEV